MVEDKWSEHFLANREENKDSFLTKSEILEMRIEERANAIRIEAEARRRARVNPI